jgi:threonyl-tRNA synthetase
MTVEVGLPDGSSLEVEDNSTVEDVAYKIGEGLGNDTVAGKIDGELVAKKEIVEDGDEVEIITEGSKKYIDVLRHSAAHVFAQALKRIYEGEVKLTIGPWTDEGFYYDITGIDIEENDFEEIEEEMEKIVEEDLDIEREMLSREDAEEFFKDNQYKRDILEDEASEGEEVSFYKQGEFKDLCKGPHVDSTGEIEAFKLLEIAGAYWRGDEENEMLTRVYGTAFPSEEELEEFLERKKEAKERDHRRIGNEMDLFSIPEHSPGCAHFHPKGMRIRRELEKYMREKNSELGYEEVRTPELNKKELWRKSGHLDFFGDEGEFFLWEQNDEEYGLKPMNCANHAYIYSSKNRSYKDLPIKISEFGNVYRNEQSGELSGLLRVRGFTQDDGHAFIREDQIEKEIQRTVKMIQEVYSIFGFYESDFGYDVKLKLETKPENAQGPDHLWEKAEEKLEEALNDIDEEYILNEGEGSFYGPKIAIDVQDFQKREWTIGTVQLDFMIPRHLDLTYTGEDNEEHTPVMVHRALLGSFDRFMAPLIEHFKGKFPTWLAPEQVRILPVTDDNQAYAEKIRDELSDFRVEIEDRSWTVGKKIQAAHDDKVPYMIIVGDDEEEASEISVRDRFENEERGFTVQEFREHLEKEVKSKALEPDFLE